MKNKIENIVYKNVDELIPYVNNPRDNENAVDAVASSIKNFGFKVPIVIDSENEIINGHTRLKAAKKIGIEEVPCIVADDLSEAQIKAFRLADNKVSELADWNWELLNNELEELSEMDFDFEMQDFGFQDLENQDDNYLDNYSDEFLINDENLEKDTKVENKLKFGNQQIVLAQDEFDLLNDKFKQYVELKGVSFGFIRWLLNEN